MSHISTHHNTHTHDSCQVHQCAWTSNVTVLAVPSHVTCMRESCHTYAHVLSRIYTSDVTHIYESCHVHQCTCKSSDVTVLAVPSQVTYMHESCHTYICTSHITNINVPARHTTSRYSQSPFTRHVTYTYESCRSKQPRHMYAKCDKYARAVSRICTSRVANINVPARHRHGTRSATNTCAQTHTHTHIHTHTHTHAHTRTHTHTSTTYTHAHAHTHTLTHKHQSTYTSSNVTVLASSQTHENTNTYTHTQTHAHKHTHTSKATHTHTSTKHTHTHTRTHTHTLTPKYLHVIQRHSTRIDTIFIFSVPLSSQCHELYLISMPRTLPCKYHEMYHIKRNHFALPLLSRLPSYVSVYLHVIQRHGTRIVTARRSLRCGPII